MPDIISGGFKRRISLTDADELSGRCFLKKYQLNVLSRMPNTASLSNVWIWMCFDKRDLKVPCVVLRWDQTHVFGLFLSFLLRGLRGLFLIFFFIFCLIFLFLIFIYDLISFTNCLVLTTRLILTIWAIFHSVPENQMGLNQLKSKFSWKIYKIN